MGTLYIVSTPIGNLADMTERGGTTLRSADRLLAEDTRRARTLLSHLGIHTRPLSLHAHNEARRVRQLLGWLDEGLDVALISDAGTPLVSDPGERAVAMAAEAGHDVVPIPGASAILAGLVASGLPCSTFTFHGFLPRSTKKRDSVLERIRTSPETAVVFEAPSRLVSLLEALDARLPAGRRLAVCREMTKVHEEVRRGTAAELARYYTDAPPRGEVTVVIAGGEDGAVATADDLVEMAREALSDGLSPTAAAKSVARRTGVSRSDAYDAVKEVRSRSRAGGGEEE